MRPRLFLVLAGAVMLPWPGLAGDGVVALQTAAPSCRTTTTPPPRYVDCGNGTVTDNQTGLVWLKNAGCIGNGPWEYAMDFAAGLSDLLDGRLCVGLTPDECDCGLSDGSSPGDWRLPSVAELYAMTRPAVVLGCSGPALTNDAGTDCWDATCVSVGACSFYGVRDDPHWSSTTTPYTGIDFATLVDLFDGDIGSDSKLNGGYFFWPVRGGQ